MNEHLLKYKITPRVFEVGKIQKITVKGIDKSSVFFDDLTYIVTINQKDGWSYKKGEENTMYTRDFETRLEVKPQNGVITFEHFFSHETEWIINIAREKSDKHIPERYKKYWPYLADNMYRGFDFCVYSLNEDLYKKRPFKGDLHIHTYDSDGAESPEMVGAQYRKFGYDFISITDHYVLKPSIDAIKSFEEIETGFKIFPGEEVHPIVNGVFHMVNFNPKESVNEIISNNCEKTQAEVLEIAKNLDIQNDEERMEIAWFSWIHDAIKKSGGICIYPHPYWVIFDSFNVHSFASEEIIKRGLCDCIEIIGGTDKKHNRMQVQFNYEMRDKGYRLPIIGTSDAHSTLVHGVSRFDQAWTVVFAENAEKIPENILKGFSAVVDNFDTDDKNVYGDLRQIKYIWFLIENYYELHDAYCNASGQAILRYMLGDKSQKALISLLEAEVEKFNVEFFGF